MNVPSLTFKVFPVPTVTSLVAIVVPSIFPPSISTVVNVVVPLNVLSPATVWFPERETTPDAYVPVYIKQFK